MTPSRSDRARARLKTEMTAKQLTGVDLAGRLQWSESKVSKLLLGRTDLGVDELDALCFAVGLQITEVLRDQGMEFCAEMTPSELRFFQTFRALPEGKRVSLAQLIDVKYAEPARAHEPAKKREGRHTKT